MSFRVATATIGLLVPCLLLAQAGAPKPKVDPVKWTLRLEPDAAAPGQKVLGRLSAAIEPGWHLYSLSTPGGPNPTTIRLASPALATVTFWEPQPKRAFDPNFKADTDTYEGSAEFLLDLEVAAGAPAGPAALAAQIRYQACTDKICLLPARRTASATLRVDLAARAVVAAIPAGYTVFQPPAAPPERPPAPARANPASQGTLQFIVVALSFGFLAIFTPCVFPMIPITMSYFLGSQTGSRRQSVVQALTFCIGVIVLFTGIGAIVTAVLGPFGLSQLGANPWVNLFIAVLLVAFGLSLMGAFEITVPSGLLTALSNASNRGGITGTLIMGLAFALTSFACTGPFVGTLLAGSTAGDRLWPVLGMLVFATGLASPFFFLALFPAYLNRLPKSGGWLTRTKVTLGFFVVAASLKFFSNIDQVKQWNLLTRERFLAAWIVMLFLAGLYLLGLLKFAGHSDEPLSLWRLSTAALILVLAVSLVPGMFGARLGELDGYVPESTATTGLLGSSGGNLKWVKNDYRAALETARQSGKPLFVSFTGYACTNCHWMKANMFTRPEIAAALEKFVLLELYTDGADAVSEQNQKLAETRFATSAIPYYAVIRADDTIVETFAGLTRNAAEFEAFLSRALRNSSTTA